MSSSRQNSDHVYILAAIFSPLMAAAIGSFVFLDWKAGLLLWVLVGILNVGLMKLTLDGYPAEPKWFFLALTIVFGWVGLAFTLTGLVSDWLDNHQFNGNHV